MTEPFADTETDRTKSRWVSRVYLDFVKDTGRSRTTPRALFHYAMKRAVADYPICGSFVGEIRVMRAYHESDGAKLPKWIKKAVKLGFIPQDAMIFEAPGEHVFLPGTSFHRPFSIEVWINRSSFDPLLRPVCEKHGAVFVSVDGRASEGAVEGLSRRIHGPKAILCLCDHNDCSASFPLDLAAKIAGSRPSDVSLDIKLKCIALLPEQISNMKIPLSSGKANSKRPNPGEKISGLMRYFKRYAVDSGKTADSGQTAELDFLEICYPGGIAAFLDRCLYDLESNFDADRQYWLLDLKNGTIPWKM